MTAADNDRPGGDQDDYVDDPAAVVFDFGGRVQRVVLEPKTTLNCGMPLFVTFRTGWMFTEYKVSKKYTKLPARTRSGYDRAMGDVADYILKDGRRAGELHVKSVNAEFVDKIYDKLKIGPDGTPRNRSALLSITVCKLAWNVVHRNKPAIVPEVNPFKGVDIDYEPKHNRAATLAELMQFVRAADKDGTLSIGTAALLAFYWLVREEDIFTRMTWSDYRPGEQPNHVLV